MQEDIERRKIDITLHYQRLHQEAELYWNRLANERQFELTKQLLTIGALILTISAAIISSSRAINFSIYPFQSVFILLSWLFIIFSILFGLRQLHVDAEYFNYLSNDESTRKSKYELLSLNDARDEVRKMKPTNPRGDEKWLLSQQIFILIGMIFLTFSAVLILSINIK